MPKQISGKVIPTGRQRVAGTSGAHSTYGKWRVKTPPGEFMPSGGKHVKPVPGKLGKPRGHMSPYSKRASY